MNIMFRGKIAVATGAATSLSRTMAARLRAEGAQVVTTYRNRPAEDDPDAVEYDMDPWDGLFAVNPRGVFLMLRRAASAAG